MEVTPKETLEMYKGLLEAERQENAALRKRVEELERRVLEEVEINRSKEFVLQELNNRVRELEEFENDYRGVTKGYIERMKLSEDRAQKSEKWMKDTQTALDMAISDYGDAIERQRKAEADLARIREAVERHREYKLVATFESELLPSDRELYEVLDKLMGE